MVNLKFANTHNMVAFLSKPAKSEGFEQIVDFMNAHTIKYALTVNLTIYTSCTGQFWATVKAKTVNGEVQLQALVDGKKIIITESIVRRDLQLEDAEGVDCLPNTTIFEQLTLIGAKTTAWNEFSSTMASAIIYEAINKEMDDSLVRAATTATRLDAEQDRGNINMTQSKATLNESSSPGTSSGNTLRSGEDRLKLKELMAFCTTLQTRVLALETTKTTQAYEIDSLGEEDASKQGRRIHDIDADEDITLVNDQDDADMFGVNDLDGDEVIVDNVDATEEVTAVIEKAKLVSATEETVNAAATTVSTANIILVTDVEITLAQALAELKITKPKADKVVIQEPEQGTTTPTLTTITAATTIAAASTRPRAKGIVIHEQEQAPTPTSKIEADYQLAQRLQAQEQEELTDAEKARLFVQFLEQRKKYFAAKRAEEKRNKPPTRAQQRSIMSDAEISQESSSKRTGDEWNG
ncbi:hypothetical protein Tco_0530533 [Tanacetum coccineum]